MLITTSLFQNRSHASIIREAVPHVIEVCKTVHRAHMHQLQSAVYCFSSPIQKKVSDITVAEIRCPDPGYGKHVVRTGTSFMYQSEVSLFFDRFNV